jgi:large-conductance mechanosensitive channel
MRWNKWLTAMILSGILVILGLIMELMKYGGTGLVVGLFGIWLTLVFGLMSTTSSLDVDDMLENSTKILNKHTEILERNTKLLEEIRDLLKE